MYRERNLAREETADWRDQAACLDEDPELFFPLGSMGVAMRQIEEAKAVCRRCPVAELCLKTAIATDSDYGVWGGFDEDERRASKRRNARRIQNNVSF